MAQISRHCQAGYRCPLAPQVFKLSWKFKSRNLGGTRVSREIHDLVKRMAAANPTWSAPRIHGELLRLGFEIPERKVSNLMPKRPQNTRPSHTWRTFLKNHAGKCSIDFFTVPTISFNILFVLVILRNSRREVVEAFPREKAPKFLIRYQDSTYGVLFRNRLTSMGIREVISAPQSPGKIRL